MGQTVGIQVAWTPSVTEGPYEVNYGGFSGSGLTPVIALNRWCAQLEKFSTADQRQICGIGAAGATTAGAKAETGGAGGGAGAAA